MHRKMGIQSKFGKLIHLATLPLKNNIFIRFLGQFPLKNIQQLVFTQSFCRVTNRRKETFSKYGRKVGMVPKSKGWSNRRKICGFDSLDLDNPSDQILSRSVRVDYMTCDHFIWNYPYVIWKHLIVFFTEFEKKIQMYCIFK